MKILSILSLSIFLLFAGCKKGNDSTKNAKLPDITQEGKNSVGFVLNDEVWVPYAKCRSFSDPCAELSARFDAAGGAGVNAFSFQIERQRKDKTSSLTLSSSGIGTVTSIGNKVDSIRVNFFDENSSGNNGYYTGPVGNSKFTITKFDRQNQIISGEFELSLIEQNGSGKTITLKDGRFDFKWNACRCSN